MNYVAERKRELLGDRQRKFYRTSRIVREQGRSRRAAEAMQSAARRLWRLFG